MDVESQQIKGVRLTSNSVDDSTGATPLIESIKYKVGSLRGMINMSFESC